MMHYYLALAPLPHSIVDVAIPETLENMAKQTRDLLALYTAIRDKGIGEPEAPLVLEVAPDQFEGLRALHTGGQLACVTVTVMAEYSLMVIEDLAEFGEALDRLVQHKRDSYRQQLKELQGTYMSYMAWSELSTILGASGDRDEVPAKRGLFGRRR